MTGGGTFSLICNDGRADALILGTQFLIKRLQAIRDFRTSKGFADTSPTLADIEQTHVLYVNAHFKPFVAIGFEYNKVRPQSGGATLGGGVSFNIPQYGDFFHDMVCRVRLSQFSGVTGKTPLHGTPSFPLNSSVTVSGKTKDLEYNIVDVSGQVIVEGDNTQMLESSGYRVDYSNFVRYCEYPGNRLFHLVKFDVNGNPLDTYNEMVPVMLEKFCIAPNKRAGHDRLVGQEVAHTGYGGLQCARVTDHDKDNTPTSITKNGDAQSNHSVGLFHLNSENLGAAAAGSTILGARSIAKLGELGLAQVDVSRKLHQVVNGPQTPKPVQSALEVWNKLRFWFNDDIRMAVPSVSIPFGNRYIMIDMNPQSLLTYEFPSIYLETISTIDDVITRTYSPIFQQFGVSEVTVEKMELYINNIFVNPEIHDIFIKRIGFSMIRVYRQHTQRCSQESSEEKLLSSLKWPIEYLFVGLRPAWNVKDTTVGTGGLVTGGNHNQWRDWHRLTRMVDASHDDHDLSAGAGTLLNRVGKVIPDQYYLPVPTVNSMSLTSHGINIFDEFGDTFFNQYVPYHFGGANINTPDDVGAMMVNLALFPREYQPSGHLNFSRARETYLKWSTSYVSATTPADLIAVAVAINFLLIADGSCILRYST